MDVLTGVIIGFFLWFVVRVVVGGIYTVNQNERAVKTSFGRAERLPGNKTTLDDPIATFLVDDERTRYIYPQVRVIPPGGPPGLEHQPVVIHSPARWRKPPRMYSLGSRSGIPFLSTPRRAM